MGNNTKCVMFIIFVLCLANMPETLYVHFINMEFCDTINHYLSSKDL